MRREPSSKYCSNPGVSAALDRLGAHIYDLPDATYAAKEARAERFVSELEKQAAENAEAIAAANPKATADLRFRRAVENPGADARELAKRAAPFLTSAVDGRAIQRIGDIIKAVPLDVFASVGAEFAREYEANPKGFANPLSVLNWRVRKAMNDTAQNEAARGREGGAR